MANKEKEDVVIFDSSLTLEQLKEMWNYGEDEEKEVKFTDEEIERLGKDVEDAIQQVIEDFLNHREE